MRKLKFTGFQWTKICLTLLLLSIYGCGNKEDKLIGKWKTKKNDIHWEFFKDHTYSMSPGGNLNSLFNFTGSWVFLDDGRIKVNNISFGNSFLKSQGDSLIVIHPNGGQDTNGLFRE